MQHLVEIALPFLEGQFAQIVRLFISVFLCIIVQTQRKLILSNNIRIEG